jgi:hypothetical protein
MKIDSPQKRKMVKNLESTFALIELHQELKLALYQKLYPDKKETELAKMLSQARLKRKSWS